MPVARTSPITRTQSSLSSLLATAALLCVSAPALAQDWAASSSNLTPALVTVSSPAAPEIDDFYRLRANTPIWFRDAASLEAARRLPAILRRAPLDGLADGPELARLVQSAIERAEPSPAGAWPADPLAHDKMLSSAWVKYVQALKAPVAGITYGDPALAPLVPGPERILADALKAPSLDAHVSAVVDVNPVYARLRDAAWSQLSKGARRRGHLAFDARVAANLDRARVLPSSGRYILVDAASAMLWMYADGEVEGAMKVVVGKRDTPTPMIAGTMHFVTLNPYWNVPADVARSNVAPFVVKYGPQVLRDMRYEVAADWSAGSKVLDPETVDWKAVAAGAADVHLRQLPGPGNSMGALKFGFSNDLGIYLHDTPKKELFAEARRNFSLGCVRVEDARQLARWILGSEPVAMSDEPEQYVHLARGIPVYITYLTARPDGRRLAFAEDVYGRDPKPGARLEVDVAAASLRD